MAPENLEVDSQYSEICVVCGCDYGSHCAGKPLRNGCPKHQGMMDWNTYGKTFIPSGRYGGVKYGTPAHFLVGEGMGAR